MSLPCRLDDVSPRRRGRAELSRSSLAEGLALDGLGQRPQLLQALALDLADPLARDVEGSADLIQRARMLAVEPVAELEHLALPARERAEDLAQRLLAQRHRGGFVGQLLVLVGEEVAELGLVLVADRLLERHR